MDVIKRTISTVAALNSFFRAHGQCIEIDLF